MFARSFPSDHEFRVRDEFDVLVRRINGSVSDAQLRTFIRERDAARPLVMDSCGAHFGILDLLVDEYPDAKFLLTLRNVYSWMNSCVGKLYGDFLGGWGSAAGEFMNCLTVLPDGSLRLDERSGSKICLEHTMEIWTAVNRGIQRTVPADRLLVLNTEDLAASTPAIASFCGIDPDRLEPCHVNRGESADFLAGFDPARLEELVDLHCSDLMRERYPGMTLAAHSNLPRSGPVPDYRDMARYFTLEGFVPTEFVQTRFPTD